MGSLLFRGVNRAAKSLAADTGQSMAAIREDVREIKEHLLKEAWPRLNETLADVQELALTGTFTVKVAALVLFIIALFFLKKQLTSLQWYKNAAQYRSKSYSVSHSTTDLVTSLESVFLHFIFWICLLMALVLVIHLVQEIFHIANISHFWPANIPFIIIIPSLATGVVILQHMADIARTIANKVMLLVYFLFVLPLTLTFHPISVGMNYAQTSLLVCLVVFITGPALYYVIAVFPVCYILQVFKLKLPLVEFLLLAYLVFFATSIVISIMTEVLLKVLIKPLWSFMSRRSM